MDWGMQASENLVRFESSQPSLIDIIRTRPNGRLIGSGNILLIDGRQPIGFLKSRLSQPSIPLGSQISELYGRSKARHRFADGLAALQKAVTPL